MALEREKDIMDNQEKKSQLEMIMDIHQQVREFVESQRSCKVTRVCADSQSDYVLTPINATVDPLSELLLKQVSLSFRVEAIAVLHYPGMRMSFRVDIMSDESLKICQMVVADERIG